jgi:hypothetical protein
MFFYQTKSEVKQVIQNFIDDYMNYEYSFWSSSICAIDDELIKLVERELDQVKVISFSYDELVLEIGSYIITISMNTVWDKWKISDLSY